MLDVVVGLMLSETKRDELKRVGSELARLLIKSHVRNTAKYGDISRFQVNPFTLRYLAEVLDGTPTPEAMAKALLFPKVLGTSISTSFGASLQRSMVENLSNCRASLVPGLDIEFDDLVESRTKYCQLKSGPNTINSGDVATITGKFKAAYRLAQANYGGGLPLGDFVVGVLYGEESDLSGHYRKIREQHFSVLVGSEFWERISGSPEGYDVIISSIVEALDGGHANEVFLRKVQELAASIRGSRYWDIVESKENRP